MGPCGGYKNLVLISLLCIRLGVCYAFFQCFGRSVQNISPPYLKNSFGLTENSDRTIISDNKRIQFQQKCSHATNLGDISDSMKSKKIVSRYENYIPLTLFRMSGKNRNIVLREQHIRALLGSNDYDVALKGDGFVHPTPINNTYVGPNGAIVHCAGEHLWYTLSNRKELVSVIEIPEGTEIPKELVLVHEQNDTYSLQCRRPMKRRLLQEEINKFMSNFNMYPKEKYFAEHPLPTKNISYSRMADNSISSSTSRTQTAINAVGGMPLQSRYTKNQLNKRNFMLRHPLKMARTSSITESDKSSVLDEKTITKPKIKDEINKDWRVILHDDNYHTIQQVCDLITMCCPMVTGPRAYEITLEVHLSGAATIAVVNKKTADEYTRSLQAAGLTVSMMPDEEFVPEK